MEFTLLTSGTVGVLFAHLHVPDGDYSERRQLDAILTAHALWP